MTCTIAPLPPLYFQDKATPQQQGESSSKNAFSILPYELQLACLTTYADWGDLARLACCGTHWTRTILYDAASVSCENKWELAQALECGTSGLQENTTMAMKLFLELANLPTKCVNGIYMPEVVPAAAIAVKSDDAFAPAMLRIAHNYLASGSSDAALAWLQCAHYQGGNADAAHEIALLYEYGTFGVDLDVVQAASWFRIAAKTGHIEAMAELGLCYELGCGVQQSDERALDWYMQAAEKGHLTSKFSVGEIFEEARGVPQSDEEACIWYYRAAIEGDEDSRQALRRLEGIARIVVPGVAKLLMD
jgi:TPR repeat protein